MLIFVYGTLMRGFCNYESLLKGKTDYIIPAGAEGLLFHMQESYPAMITGAGTVRGEVMKLSDEGILKSLDRLEGYVEGSRGNLYERVERNAKLETGEVMMCWMYFYAD